MSAAVTSPRTMPNLVLGRLSAARAAILLEKARAAAPTYGPVGATLTGRLDAVDLHLERVVGHGQADFEQAVGSLHGLGQQRAVATVIPADASATLGQTILIALRFGPIMVVAPNRIVSVVDEPRRWGFAYGTLPGHPEVGEEAFVVEYRADDAVVVHIIAIAHAAFPGARLLQPLLVPVQRFFARRYLGEVERAVANSSPA